MRYFLKLSYQGTYYHGWQIQPNAITVQEILEDRISKILGKNTPIFGAGRTDTGVHASQMIAHFDAENIQPEILRFKLNSFLPKDIAIHDIRAVKNDAHARFDAIYRTYHYYIHFEKNPFKNDVSWYFYHGKLDVNLMNQASQILFDFDEFTSFARLHADNKTDFCKIMKAVWTEEKDGLKFEIRADRFLRNMVRAIVGTLVEIGQHKITLNQFIKIIEKKDRKFASASAPAHGLFLAEVAYQDEIYI